MATSTQPDCQPPPTVGNLSNPILPIFQPSNFTGPDWDYALLTPALRLASRLLNTDPLLEFPHAIFSGRSLHLPHPTNLGSAYKAFFRTNHPGSPLSASELASIRLNLFELAQDVKFSLNPDPDELTSYCASTQQSASGGWESHILISRFQYSRLSDAVAFPVCPETEYLKFADLLCHELMHSCVWTCGASHYEPFEHGVFAETGLEWSNHIWGGLIEDHCSSIGALQCTEYPLPSRFRHYANTTDLFYVVEVPKLEVRWEVDFEWVRALFTERFWEVGVPARGAEALKSRKEIGSRFVIGEDGENRLFMPVVGGEDYLEGVPEGFLPTPDGLHFSRVRT